MFKPQKSFEKSLRSTAVAAYQVPIVTPLKTEIHKGCTGKAHACGTIKNTNTILVNKSSSPSPVAVKVKAKCENKSLRKNSLSSETVSDSGSESWKEHSGSSSSNVPAIAELPKPLKRNKSLSYASPANIANGSARRRTSDSVISADLIDNAKRQQRGRLLSDGDGKQNADADISRLRRTSSFRSKNIPPLIPAKPKPVASSAVIKQNGNFNSGRLRSSFRALKSQNQAVNWNLIWENSFAIKSGGGNFRTIDKNVLCAKVIN
jgi:myosin-18